MRALKRQVQNVWFCTCRYVRKGIDNVFEYSKPEQKKFSVSATGGKSLDIGIGLVEDYDRYITSYERSFKPSIGTLVFVDIEPVLDEYGNLVLKDDEITPVTSPDYMISVEFDTQKGYLARYGIKKVGDFNARN